MQYTTLRNPHCTNQYYVGLLIICSQVVTNMYKESRSKSHVIQIIYNVRIPQTFRCKTLSTLPHQLTIPQYLQWLAYRSINSS